MTSLHDITGKTLLAATKRTSYIVAHAKCRIPWTKTELDFIAEQKVVNEYNARMICELGIEKKILHKERSEAGVRVSIVYSCF